MRLISYRNYILTAVLLQSAATMLLAQGYDLPVGSISTHVGSTFSVDEANTGSYAMSLAALYPLGGGTVIARCRVTDPEDSGYPRWNRMFVTYRDSDAAASQYRVAVSLRRVHVTTGASSTIVTFDSNTTAGPGTGVLRRGAEFTHTFDFLNYAYYLEATITGPSGIVLVQPVPALYVVQLAYYEQVPG